MSKSVECDSFSLCTVGWLGDRKGIRPVKISFQQSPKVLLEIVRDLA